MKILIIEDEAGISSFLKQGLEEEEFKVTVTDNGIAGLKIAETQKFNVILLDWMLPGMDGISVCKRIREKDPHTHIIFLTAKDTLQETIAGLQVGANDYIKKPFSFDELLERIKVQLRNVKLVQEDLVLGPIILKRDKHQVFNNGQVVVLTQKEFALLEYLMHHKDSVCTRTSIIEDVWNIHFEYDTGVIDVFMNSLRKKLNLKRDQDFIKTVRGIGYIASENNG